MAALHSLGADYQVSWRTRKAIIVVVGIIISLLNYSSLSAERGIKMGSPGLGDQLPFHPPGGEGRNQASAWAKTRRSKTQGFLELHPETLPSALWVPP